MFNRIHKEIVENLLSSITLSMGGDGAEHSFLFGPPGARLWERRLGVTIYYHSVELNLTALQVRSVGANYLRALPLDEICSNLKHFISENFDYIGDVVFGNRDQRPFNEWIPEANKAALAAALAACHLFKPRSELTVFPLVPVSVGSSFVSDQYFFSSPHEENPFFLEDQQQMRELDPRVFPPQLGFAGKVRRPGAWLGVYSPDYRASLKTRSSVLGALALTALPDYRHMFSGRELFGGRCTISKNGLTYSFEKVHTPPCMHDIEITDIDAGWMKTLSDKLRSPDSEVLRELKALEYFYRAWSLSPEERFPILCMSLDAVLGDSNNATQAVIDGVNSILGNDIPQGQLRALLGLRASVIHGGAPDVYDSSKYPKYYKQYGCDPIRDLELVVSACLREKIFGGQLAEHPDPNAEIIKAAQDAGRLPPTTRSVSIFNPKA
ncbi:hypothetical protein [Roseicyclus persicicus]|uniref:Apea-like HEPN domain-containing protein n=1 Tax=Roseicyclus persicicus TaxID=2650661 RepID=A0A7X6JVP4_9RHOB|nr:hypothetical protein [Roseibacterium persicicum]NKX43557.1 hypothetical protein [Roseibacterium persicicum]